MLDDEYGSSFNLTTKGAVTHSERADRGMTTIGDMPAPSSIDPAKKSARRRRADNVMTTAHLAPSVTPIDASVSGGIGGDGQKDVDNQTHHAIAAPFAGQNDPDNQRFIASAGGGLWPFENQAQNAPSVSIAGQIAVDNQIVDAGIGEGQKVIENHATCALAEIVAEIVELQKQRVFCIKSQSRADRSCESFIARFLGFRTDLPEKERKALFARAGTLRRAVEKGGLQEREDQRNGAPNADGEGQCSVDNQTGCALSVCTPIILNSAVARQAWDRHRKITEARMSELARSLPIHIWAKAVSGFGPLGLAIIIGEAGNFSSFETKERVWKRLGLAVINGERQQKRTNLEQAIAHGYNPRRRAEIWTIADSMFKHQWRGEKEGIPAHAVGPYGEAYARRKAYTENVHEDWSPARHDKDARRIMTKVLIEDVWRVWRGLPALVGRGREQYVVSAVAGDEYGIGPTVC